MTIPMHVGRGEHRGALSLFPVWSQVSPGPAVVLADERSVTVTELEPPQVPTLQVTVISQVPALLLDGLLLHGGWQDRTVAGSTVLDAGESGTVPVRCVERDRWGGVGGHVPMGRASSRVRAVDDQLEVWERVAAERARASSPPDVSDLAPLPGQCGVVVGVGGRPLALECFADPGLFAAAFAAVVAGAARDAVGVAHRRTTGHDARAFVAAVEGMRLRVDRDAGHARALSGARNRLRGQGVQFRGRRLHTGVVDTTHPAVAA